jgi:hypothetical protein
VQSKNAIVQSVWLFGLDIEERSCWGEFDVIEYYSHEVFLDRRDVVVMEDLYFVEIADLEG